jgi:hypothetical protein
MKFLPSFAVLLLLIGCVDSTVPKSNPPEAKTGSSPTRDTSSRWQDQIGKTITMSGKAINHKVGAYISGENKGIYVDLPETHWPIELYHGGDESELVRVTGTVAQRSDLPVFIPDPNIPAVQGIPMPTGTILDEAAKRFILEGVTWQRIEDRTEQNVGPKSPSVRFNF